MTSKKAEAIHKLRCDAATTESISLSFTLCVYICILCLCICFERVFIYIFFSFCSEMSNYLKLLLTDCARVCLCVCLFILYKNKTSLWSWYCFVTDFAFDGRQKKKWSAHWNVFGVLIFNGNISMIFVFGRNIILQSTTTYDNQETKVTFDIENTEINVYVMEPTSFFWCVSIRV